MKSGKPIYKTMPKYILYKLINLSSKYRKLFYKFDFLYHEKMDSVFYFHNIFLAKFANKMSNVNNIFIIFYYYYKIRNKNL